MNLHYLGFVDSWIARGREPKEACIHVQNIEHLDRILYVGDVSNCSPTASSEIV